MGVTPWQEDGITPLVLSDFNYMVVIACFRMFFGYIILYSLATVGRTEPCCGYRILSCFVVRSVSIFRRQGAVRPVLRFQASGNTGRRVALQPESNRYNVLRPCPIAGYLLPAHSG